MRFGDWSVVENEASKTYCITGPGLERRPFIFPTMDLHFERNGGLIDLIREEIARRAKAAEESPLRDGRHDRGWPHA